MLYMIGTLALDTRPFAVDAMDREAGADIVTKPVIGGLAPSEFMGEGADTIRLSGQLLPSRIGGLDELEIAHEMRRKGARFPLMRGDGRRIGWFAITGIREAHNDLMRDGVGFTVRHEISLKRVQSDSGAGAQIVSGLLSLFNELELI